MTVVRHPSDRRCTNVDPRTGIRCITRLCALNPGPECFVHSRRQPRSIMAEERAERERRAFEAVMKQVEAA